MKKSSKVPVAIQLYSVRDVIHADVPGTLKRLAAMGYEGVETAGCYNLKGDALRAMLDGNGLRCAGSHVGLPQLEGDALEETVATSKALGTDRLIIASAPLDDLDATIGRMLVAHEAAGAFGMRVGYHNHAKEFETVEGVTLFDRILGAMPCDFLAQVDIGWASAAGQDVAALLRKHAGRIETVHVKEFKPGAPDAVVGEGTIEWPGVMDLLENETGVQWYVVEQERFRVGPIESVAECIRNIRCMGR